MYIKIFKIKIKNNYSLLIEISIVTIFPQADNPFKNTIKIIKQLTNDNILNVKLKKNSRATIQV